MIKVRISTRAADYLRSERTYLSQFSKQAASELTRQFRRVMKTLSEYPDVGVQIVPFSEIRRLVLTPYIVEYERQGEEIVILLIRHGKQHNTILEEDDPIAGSEEPDHQ